MFSADTDIITMRSKFTSEPLAPEDVGAPMIAAMVSYDGELKWKAQRAIALHRGVEVVIDRSGLST